MVSLCHLWHSSICDASAIGNFHMHVHMLLYTQQIKSGTSAGAQAQRRYYSSVLMRETGRDDLISLDRKIRWKSRSLRTLSSASGKLTDIMLFDLQPKPSSWRALNVVCKQIVWWNKWYSLLIKEIYDNKSAGWIFCAHTVFGIIFCLLHNICWWISLFFVLQR